MGEAPRIVKEIRKTIEVRAPPDVFQVDGLELSEWDLTDDWVELYISYDCFRKMLHHCMAHMGKQMEVMGLLMGDIFQWKNRIYTMAEDIVAADEEDSTETSVRFGPSGLEEVARALDGMEYEYLIVGWYHSHPGFSPFLSDKDLETQKKNFNKPYHATIVIDPINRQFRSFKVIEKEYIEKRYLLYEETALERELTAKKKREILHYLDTLIQKQLQPDRHGPPAVVPGGQQRSEAASVLPPDVRQTIEEDIKRMISDHNEAGQKRKGRGPGPKG